jgi:hypothetical protein
MIGFHKSTFHFILIPHARASFFNCQPPRPPAFVAGQASINPPTSWFGLHTRSGQFDDVWHGQVAAPGDWRASAGANVAQAFGHDAAGMGDISMPIPARGFSRVGNGRFMPIALANAAIVRTNSLYSEALRFPGLAKKNKSIMKTKLHCFFILLALLAGVHQAGAQGTTAFTYQGQLHDGGTNANGAYTMIFKLYDSASNGNQIGSTITTSPTLANGLFSVNLDFGSAFNGSARWLDITITNGGVTQTLSPRVQVLPTPYAQFAAVAATVTNGGIMNAQLAVNAVTTTNIQSGAVTTTQIANGAVTDQNLSANAVGTINIQSNAITSALLASNAVATINIQNGAITDSKIAALTSLFSTYGSETNLRVVRGSMGQFPTPSGPVVGTSRGSYTNFGSGYTATYYPPGSGGSLVGYYYVGGDGNGNYVFSLVNGSIINPGIAAGEWIEANGPGDAEILQVQSVYAPTNNPFYFTTYGTGCGSLANNPYNQVWVNPRLANEWDITFTHPFSGVPTIAVGSVSSPGAFSSGSPPLVSAQGVAEGGGTTFQAIVGYTDISFLNNGSSAAFGGGCWPYGDGFSFIAIGPK